MSIFPEQYSKPVLHELSSAERLGWSAKCAIGGGPGTDPKCAAGPGTPDTICVFLSSGDRGSSGGFLTPARVGSGL